MEFAIIWVAALLFLLFMGWRNSRVYHYQHKMLHLVSAHARSDILAGRPWVWRYDLYDQVSYAAMLLHFWRPLESFYDPAMLEEEQAG